MTPDDETARLCPHCGGTGLRLEQAMCESNHSYTVRHVTVGGTNQYGIERDGKYVGHVSDLNMSAEEAERLGNRIVALLNVPARPGDEAKLQRALRDAMSWLVHYGPETCGQCGGPDSRCDTDCAAAARLGEDFAKWRALLSETPPSPAPLTANGITATPSPDALRLASLAVSIDEVYKSVSDRLARDAVTIMELRAALAFYANRENWGTLKKRDADHDRGERARAALAALALAPTPSSAPVTPETAPERERIAGDVSAR